MLASGDWLVPRLDRAIYLDKPPLTFWLIAGSLRAVRPLRARGTPAARARARRHDGVRRLARHDALGRAHRRRSAGLAFAISLGPFAGAAVLTPDGLLACAVTATAALLWKASRDADRLRWWLLAGAAAGAGLMIKGAAMLVFAAPLFLGICVVRRGVRWLGPPDRGWRSRPRSRSGSPGTSGPRATCRARPPTSTRTRSPAGSSKGYDRNAELSKLFTLYLPTLFGGALPWSLGWPSRRALGRAPPRQLARPTAQGWYVGLWFFLPLAVFCAASSRLPLYLLPLFAPLALFTGRSIAIAGAGTWRASPALAPRRRRSLRALGAGVGTRSS